MKKRIPSALVFLVMKIKKKHLTYISKICCEEKHFNLLLLGQEGKRNYVPIKYFNTIMYNHTLDHGKKNFFAIIVSIKY